MANRHGTNQSNSRVEKRGKRGMGYLDKVDEILNEVLNDLFEDLTRDVSRVLDYLESQDLFDRYPSCTAINQAERADPISKSGKVSD